MQKLSYVYIDLFPLEDCKTYMGLDYGALDYGLDYMSEQVSYEFFKEERYTFFNSKL